MTGPLPSQPATPAPSPAVASLEAAQAAVALVEFGACPQCGAATLVELPADWQTQADAGAIVPIYGCGNPWHYATPTGRVIAGT